MANAIFRYQVPVDGRWHTIDLTGQILHVASRDPAYVEFWAMHHHGEVPRPAQFRVVPTGYSFASGMYRGTAIAPGGQLVWHLIEASWVPGLGDGPEAGDDSAQLVPGT